MRDIYIATDFSSIFYKQWRFYKLHTEIELIWKIA